MVRGLRQRQRFRRQQSAAATVTNNVQPISVDAGPQPQSFLSSNIAFTNVTICVPGTSSCQTIDHVQVDTGSQGLRLLQGVVTLNLPPQNVSGRPLAECLSFADGFVWGTVAVADIQLAGETASSSQVQIIVPSTGSPAVPSTCTGPPGGNGNEGDSAMALGANGIVGVALFQEDATDTACLRDQAAMAARIRACIHLLLLLGVFAGECSVEPAGPKSCGAVCQ